MQLGRWAFVFLLPESNGDRLPFPHRICRFGHWADACRISVLPCIHSPFPDQNHADIPRAHFSPLFADCAGPRTRRSFSFLSRSRYVGGQYGLISYSSPFFLQTTDVYGTHFSVCISPLSHSSETALFPGPDDRVLFSDLSGTFPPPAIRYSALRPRRAFISCPPTGEHAPTFNPSVFSHV